MGISYAVLPNKFDLRYIRHLRLSYECMAESTIEKYPILTNFGNKKILENKKKNAPARTMKFSKKDDKMIVFKTPQSDLIENFVDL